MKTLLSVLVLMLAACGSDESEEPEAAYGEGWVEEEIGNLNNMCLASVDAYSDVKDPYIFCACWSEFWIMRVTPEQFDANMATLLELHQQAVHDQCIARQL